MTASVSPLISVVLPTFNRAHLLARSIGSVLDQTYGNLELIVCDDGSTDDTADLVASFEDPRLRYLRSPHNRGAAAARNRGIDAAQGELVAFQDSDDEWLKHKLQRHVDVIGAAPRSVGVTYSDMVRLRRTGQELPHPAPAVLRGRLIDRERLVYQVYNLGIQATVMRRAAFDAGHRFDERFRCFDDLELFIRLAERYAFLHIPEALVRYHETPGLSTDKRAELRARLRLLRLHALKAWPPDLLFVSIEVARVGGGMLRLAARRYTSLGSQQAAARGDG